MSQYATSTDFTTLGLPAAALDSLSGIVDDHLIAASGVVDSHLRGRYRLPLVSPAPQELVFATVAIAAYTFMCRRGFDASAGADANVRTRYEDAMAWLRELSAGRVSLPLEADATPTVHDGRPIMRSRVRSSSNGSPTAVPESFWVGGGD